MSWHVAATFTNQSDVCTDSERMTNAMAFRSTNEHEGIRDSFREIIPRKGREEADRNPWMDGCCIWWCYIFLYQVKVLVHASELENLLKTIHVLVSWHSFKYHPFGLDYVNSQFLMGVMNVDSWAESMMSAILWREFRHA